MMHELKSAGITAWVLIILFGPGDFHVRADNAPPPGISVLDRAFQMLNKSKKDVSLVGHEPSYQLSIGRNPTISDSLHNPFFLPAYLQLYASRLNGSSDSITPQNTLTNVLNITGSIVQDEDHSVKPESRPLIDVFEDLHVRFQRTPLSPGTRKYLTDQISAFPEGLEDVMVSLCEALLEAATKRQEAIKLLTTEERHKIIDSPLSYMMSDDRIRNSQYVDREQLEIAQIMRKVDIAEITKGMQLLLDAVEVTRPKLEWIHKRTLAVKNDELFLEFKSPIGLILVGGPGINRYDRDAALIVDIDGSDVYCNNAGGCFPLRGGVALVIDVGGNDIYVDQRLGVQGSGILGLGLLIDYHGSDVYVGGDMSQGSGFAGLGMIYDEKGNDSYHAGVLSQGSGVFGVGLSVDVDGHDFISCDSMGQGFASTLGLGFLVNVYGRDNYTIGNADSILLDRDSGFGQGASIGFFTDSYEQKANLWGGLGVLIDGHGNDTFFCNHHGQGSASHLGAAALIDCQGNDLFDGRYKSQGYAEQLSCGMLIDQNGDDRYFSDEYAQSCAIGQGAAFLLDYNGNDIYRLSRMKGQAYAEKDRSVAIHIDYNGDDRYYAHRFAQADVLRPEIPVFMPTAIFINHFGNDEYSDQEEDPILRADNLTWHHSETALGFDTNLEPQLYFADQPSLSILYHFEMNPLQSLEGLNEEEFVKLGSRNMFDRYFAGNQVIQKGETNFTELVKNLDLGHSEFKRALEESVISLLLISGEKELIRQGVHSFASSSDPITRKLSLHLINEYKLFEEKEVAREMLYDDEYNIRLLAIDTIEDMRDEKAIPILESMVSHDKEAVCRWMAVNALADIASSSSFPVIREALRDPSKLVQYAAISSLAKYEAQGVIRLLEMLMATDEMYIQRIAAKSLIELGEITGIPVLIHSLQFRSAENCSDCGTDVLYEFLRNYTGLSLPNNQDDWQIWWQDRSSDFDLKGSIRSYKKFKELFDKRNELNLQVLFKSFRTYKEENPEYSGMDSMYAEHFKQQLGTLDKNVTDRMASEIYGFIAGTLNEKDDYLTYIGSLIELDHLEAAGNVLKTMKEKFGHFAEMNNLQSRLNNHDQESR